MGRDDKVGFSVTISLCTLLPSSGYWYFPSEIGSTCTSRLDLLLAVPCIMVGVVVVFIGVTAITLSKVETTRGSFVDWVASPLIIGSGPALLLCSLYDLYSVGSCWWDFRHHPNYGIGHLTVFILYGLFALLSFLFAGLLIHFFAIDEYLPLRAKRRKEKQIYNQLRKWVANHKEDKLSEETTQTRKELFRMVMQEYGSRYPVSVRSQILQRHFAIDVFKVYEREWVTPEEFFCQICSEEIRLSDQYATIKLGPVHLDCFVSSHFVDQEIERLLTVNNQQQNDLPIPLDVPDYADRLEFYYEPNNSSEKDLEVTVIARESSPDDSREGRTDHSLEYNKQGVEDVRAEPYPDDRLDIIQSTGG